MDDIVNQAKKQSNQPSDRERPDGVTDLTIILWRNGMQIGEGGEFKHKDDPQNQQFVKQL